MAFYLSRFGGVGTLADPYRPVGVAPDEPCAILDLRADASKPDGYCLVASDVARPDNGGRRKLAEDKGERGVAQRMSQLGLTLPDLPFDQLLAHLMLVEGDDARRDRWNRLRPANGVYEIWLGAKQWSMPAVAGGAVFVEKWDRAASTTLGNGWVELNGDLQIITNPGVMGAVTSGSGYAVNTFDVGSPDMLATVYLQSTASTGLKQFIALTRFANNASLNAYLAFPQWTSSGVATMTLMKVVAGAFTSLGSQLLTVTAVGADNTRCRAVGSSISGTSSLLACPTLTATDTAFTGPNFGGCAYASPTSNTRVRIGRFEVGTLNTQPASAVRSPSATDNYNRADSSSLGAAWVENSGDSQIIGNALAPVSTVAGVWARNTTDTGSDDNWSESTLATPSAAGTLTKGINAHCRHNAGTDAAGSSFYYASVYWTTSLSAASIQLGRVVDGVATAMQVVALVGTVAAGDRVRCEARGTSIRAFVNDVEKASVEDVGIASGHFIGTGVTSMEDTSRSRVDAWQGGTFYRPSQMMPLLV